MRIADDKNGWNPSRRRAFPPLVEPLSTYEKARLKMGDNHARFLRPVWNGALSSLRQSSACKRPFLQPMWPTPGTVFRYRKRSAHGLHYVPFLMNLAKQPCGERVDKKVGKEVTATDAESPAHGALNASPFNMCPY
jgi:hypothetical protein